jgi:hypothetical protein
MVHPVDVEMITITVDFAKLPLSVGEGVDSDGETKKASMYAHPVDDYQLHNSGFSAAKEHYSQPGDPDTHRSA